MLAAADEMHNFYPVVFRETHARPLRAAHHLEIIFDGDARGSKRQFFNQLFQRCVRRHFLRLTVQDDISKRLFLMNDG